MRKPLTILVLLSFLLIVPIAGNADLIGDQIFGTIYLSSTTGLEIAIVGAGVEFQVSNGGESITADFTGNSLTVTHFFAGLYGTNGWEMTFVNLDQDFPGLTLVSSSISGLTWSLSPLNTIILDCPVSQSPLDSWSATFSIAPVAPVPLPPLCSSSVPAFWAWRDGGSLGRVNLTKFNLLH